MTAWDVLGALRRRWYVAILGAVVIVAACAQFQQAQGVYWCQVDLVFLAPQSARNLNTLGTTSESLISTAGVVANAVNGGKHTAALSSPNVSLVGAGIRRGHWVRLPSVGGQWAKNFDRPVLDVQVAAASEADVRAQVEQLTSEIRRTLDTLQAHSGAGKSDRIFIERAPQAPVVAYVATQSKRAMAGAALLGSLLTLAAVVLSDRTASPRSSGRHHW